MPGFDDYIEVFRAGTHKSNNGESYTYTNADLDYIVKNYNNSKYEAPIVIGHPTESAPAYGWVSDLKRTGETLLAKFKEVVPEFSELVEKGLYKKRSISLYPDLTLRHVGFLGAVPPAIKGLKDIQFSDTTETFEFSEQNDRKWSVINRILRSFRDFIIDKYDIGTADKILDSWDLDTLSTPEEKPMVQQFMEEDILSNELKEQLAKAEELVKSYSEELEAAKAELAQQKKNNQELIAAQKKSELASFCDGLINDGRMKPADKESTLAFMESLSDNISVEFSETKKSQLDLYKEKLLSQPVILEFSEIAKKRDGTKAGDAVSLAKEIRNYMDERTKKGVKISYGDALSEIKGGL